MEGSSPKNGTLSKAGTVLHLIVYTQNVPPQIAGRQYSFLPHPGTCTCPLTTTFSTVKLLIAAFATIKQCFFEFVSFIATLI